MDRQLLSILGIGLGVVALVVGIFIVRSGFFAGQTDARRELATANGWTYSEETDGELWRLSGVTNGITWSCDARRPRRTGPREQDVPHRTRLVARVPGGGAMLRPIVPDGLAGAVVRKLLELTQVDAVSELQDTGRTAPIGEPLNAYFQAIITDPEALDHLTRSASSTQLLALAESHEHPPIVTWLDGELTITIGKDLADASAIEAFIRRGLAIAGSLPGA